MNAAVRVATDDDVQALTGLLGQLGYPATADDVRARLAVICRRDDHAVLVAVIDSGVAGFIEVEVINHLASEPRVEIAALVVDAVARGQRLGARLVAAAEEWANLKGIGRMLVRSRTTRADAHRFYLREGYAVDKEQKVFLKRIEGPTG